MMWPVLNAEIDAGGCGSEMVENEACSPTILCQCARGMHWVRHGDLAVAKGSVGAAEHHHLLRAVVYTTLIDVQSLVGDG